MSNDHSSGSGGKKLPTIKRRTVSVSQESLVQTSPLFADHPLPLLIQPAVANVALTDWVSSHHEQIEEDLQRYGGVLFRGFGISSPEAFERLIEAASSAWAEYREPATPRSQVSGNIYTSTDYPPEQSIFLHNENSHCTTWPLKIFFCCLVPAQEGGATPIADCRRVYQRIDPAIRERFEQRGWMYVRNFGSGLGFPWQKVFQTTERAGVEAYCRANAMQWEWQSGDRLRVSYIRPATALHPRSGEPIWFNHGTFFNASTLEPELRATLLADFSEDELPYNTYYGDGTPIEPAVMAALQAAYDQETVAFPWQQGDVLMLDNMLVAHGRAPFVGPRKVVVGMAETYGREQADLQRIDVPQS